MMLTTLKSFRFIIPGVIILLYAEFLGWTTALWKWDTSILAKLEDAEYSATVLIAAAIYYFTPLREWSNLRFFNDVNENIRSQLIRISGLPDDPKRYTWKSVRGIFYSIVDNDASLRTKAQLAYFNGLIWTTLADLRAIAFVFAVVSILIAFFDTASAILAALLFCVVALISYGFSIAVTWRHKQIGDEQLEIIRHNHQSEVATKVANIP